MKPSELMNTDLMYGIMIQSFDSDYNDPIETSEIDLIALFRSEEMATNFLNMLENVYDEADEYWCERIDNATLRYGPDDDSTFTNIIAVNVKDAVIAEEAIH